MNTEELSKFIQEKQSALQKMQFGVAGSGTRNTRAIRNTRREIAQALTECTKRAKVGT